MSRAQRFSWVLVALLAVQAALGRLFPDQYRDVEWIQATWLGNDCVTLLLATPLLILSLWLTRRGSVRGTLLWYGLLAYSIYNYAFYMLGAVLNAFFLLYVAAFLVAAVALLLALVDASPEELTAGFHPSTPVRLLGGYFMVVAVGLTLIWVGLWAAHIVAGQPTPVEPEFFRLIAALDLTLMVPVLGVGGWLLSRRRPWGFVIATLAGVQASLYLLILSINSGIAVHRGLVDSPGELPIWVPLTVCTTAATLLLFVYCSRPVAASSGASTAP